MATRSVVTNITYLRKYYYLTEWLFVSIKNLMAVLYFYFNVKINLISLIKIIIR